MLSVHSGTYDSRSRALIRDVTGLLRLPWVQGELFENQLAHYLRGMGFISNMAVVDSPRSFPLPLLHNIVDEYEQLKFYQII